MNLGQGCVEARRWVAGATAGLVSVVGTCPSLAAGFHADGTCADLADARPLSWEEFSARHEGVLGTSLDLWVRATDAEGARECERVVLAEIERLRRILST